LIKFLPYKQTPACPLSTLSCLLLSSQRSERRSRKGATIGSLLDPLHCQFSLLTLSVEGLHSSLFTPLLVAKTSLFREEVWNQNFWPKPGTLANPNFGPTFWDHLLVPHFSTFWSHIDPQLHNYTTTTTLPYYSTTTTAATNNNNNMTTTKTTASTPLTLEQIINFDPPGEDNKCHFRYTNSNNERQELCLSPCTGRNLAEVLRPQCSGTL
jgi:hypothetical protein